MGSNSYVIRGKVGISNVTVCYTRGGGCRKFAILRYVIDG